MSVTSLFRLPRRPRTAPKHAAPSVARIPGPAGPTGDMHVTVPAPEGEAPARRPVSGWSLAAAAPAPDPAVAEAAETLREILAGAIPEPPATELLARVRDGLRAIPGRPGARLRNIFPGTWTGPSEPLSGFPAFAGMSRMDDGTPCAGLWLGIQDEDGRLVLDVPDPAWLDELIDAAVRARRALDATTKAAASSDEDEEGGEAA